MPGLHRTILAFLTVLLAGCQEKRLPARASFYFWRTRLELSPVERKALSALEVKRLRVRLFDVVRDGRGIHPVGKLKGGTSGVFPVPEVLPVVFLREAVFRGVVHPDSLGRRILTERDRICQESRLPCKGLELDCDWARGSRTGFFELCRILGDSLHARGQSLRSTLRLHQYHGPGQTGVPPVDRLTLMAYNMGPTTASPDRQSILDLKELARWLETRSVYPKPLDVALPLYSWAIAVRDGRPVDLFQSIDRTRLSSIPWLEAQGNGLWIARKGAFLDGRWIRKDDVLKLEEPSFSDLREAASLLARKLPAQADREVIFFDLSREVLARHPPSALGELLEPLGTQPAP